MRSASHIRPSPKPTRKTRVRPSSHGATHPMVQPRERATNAPKFDIRVAKAQLHRALVSARTNEFAMYRDLRDVGLTWIRICAWCDDPAKHGGEKISAFNWARDHAPIGKRWLDEHARFARDWGKFVESWRWAQAQDYTSDRRPSLRTARELIDTKKRADTYHSAINKVRTVVRVGTVEDGVPGGQDGEVVIVNPAMTILRGDAADMMRKHVPDGSVDLIACDPPYFLQSPENEVINYLHERGGMTPRFNQDWDGFPDLESYEQFTEQWVTEAIRCLDVRGSLFICCSHLSVAPIGRFLQRMGLSVVQNIQIIKLDGRPIVKPRVLRYSHFTVIWAVRDGKTYRFDGPGCKRAHWPDDPLSKGGEMMRDVWFIPTAKRENETGFPAQKPTELYERFLTMCGKPGGTMLDLFSGSGTGAVAALRWGMKAVSIERDPGYVANICRRVEAERTSKARHQPRACPGGT